MTNFHDISFPFPLAFGASGGPIRKTDITQLASGAEHRNTPHAKSRRRYNAGAGIKTIDELHDLIAFFEARFGQLHSFRFHDPFDFKSCKPSEGISSTDQPIGTGDGETIQFHLTKTYLDEAGLYQRRISKPIVDSVKVALDGEPISNVNFTVDSLSGEVLFNTAPAMQSIITAGFEFDVPVRFDTAQLDIALEVFGAGQAVSIPLIEVFENA